MAITLEQAKSLKVGTILHDVNHHNADGTPRRWKVNGAPQTWKRNPARVRVPLKHGLYSYDAITENDLHLVSFPGAERDETSTEEEEAQSD